MITFGKKGRSAKAVQFCMCSDTIVNTDCIKHDGVHVNEQLNDKVKVQNGCCKAKASLFSMLSIKMHPLHLNPLTSAIYICRSDNNQRGFVPDVVQVLEKYELSFELINYSH